MIETLHGPRLDLRPLAEADEGLYVRLYGDPQAMQRVATAQEAIVAAKGFRIALAMNAKTPAKRLFWVIEDRACDEPLGLIGLTIDPPGSGEVGVLLPREHQGRGVATEAIAALADHAFAAMSLARLHTRHEPGHALAAGLMTRLGFEHQPCAPGSDRWRWQLTPEAWARSQAGLS